MSKKRADVIQGWNKKNPVIIKDVDNFTRVNLNPSDFDRMILQHGTEVKVFRTVHCPNVKSVDGGEHEIDCELCNGSALVDRHPLEMKVFIQAQSGELLQSVEGLHDGNTVSITFPIGIDVQYYTLVELMHYTDVIDQLVARSEGDLDNLTYKAHRVNLLISKSGKEYFEGTDFTLNSNGSVLWVSGRGPGKGVIYSIQYEASLQFRLIRSIHSNRFEQIQLADGRIAQVKLPEQWFAQKEFLVRRKGYDNTRLFPNKIHNYNSGNADE